MFKGDILSSKDSKVPADNNNNNNNIIIIIIIIIIMEMVATTGVRDTNTQKTFYLLLQRKSALH
jgi:hypothetical protein